MWNLSLLSRGYGELVNREHERLDVYLEAQDYFNWRSWRNTDCISLKLYNSKDFVHDYHNSAVPKTFSTRRGALVLYSEDLALRAWQRQYGAKWRQATRLRLSTLSDLARAVLAYGRKENGSSRNQIEPYLHFLTGHKNRPGNRKIRPGYSAKRYLTCLTETCDPSLLHRLQGSGCIHDLSLLRGISLNSLLLHQTKCDLSEVPRPYQVLPCLPFSPHYQNWPDLEEEEEEENGEEHGLDAGESCPISHVEEGGLQPDSCRSGEGERQLKRESEVECAALQESGVYLLIALPPSDRELDKEEPEQPPRSSLIKDQTAGGKGHGQRCSTLGRPVIDSSQLFSQKSNVTYYGGSMAGSRRGLCVKSRPSHQYSSRQPLEPVDFKGGRLQLPPISSETEAGVWPIEEGNNRELELPKLPVPRRRPVAAARHAGWRGGRAKPEAAQFEQQLVLPPLTDGDHQNQNEEDVHDEVTEHKEKLQCPISVELPKVEGVDEADQLSVKCLIGTEMRSGLDGQENGFLPQISAPSKTEERTVGFVEKKLEEDDILLEESVVQSLKGGPVLQLLPPIQGTKGPGKQSSMACFRRKARRTKTSALGIVRGTVPEKLREVHKDISVGSLLMAPDGEIVRLSLLDSVQGPSGSFPGCSSHPKGSKPLVYGFDGKKDRSITKERMEGGSQTDSAARSSCQEEDIWSSSDDDDILCEIDGDSSQSQTPTQLTSEQRRARKALRRGRKRQTQLDGTSSGGPVSESARGAKVNSDRRAKRRAKVNSDRRAKGEAMVNSDTRAKGEAMVNSDTRAKGEAKVNSDRRARGEATVNSDRRAKGEATVRRRQAPDDMEEMALGEDGNLHRSYPPGRTRHGTEYDSVHERERAQGTRQTTHASTYRRSAAGSSLAGWSQSEHGSLDAAEELGSPSSHREVENGCLPKASRRKKLQKDGFVAEDNSETDVEDWEAEPWRELIEGRTRINAKKHKSKRKGRRSPNQDPSIGDGDWVPSSGEESTGSILVPGENSPSEQEGTRQSRRRLAANDPSELGRAPRPNRAPGGNKERNKSNGRAEFVVGRPREKRAQHQYLPPGKQQKEVSQQRRKAMREGEMEEDIITQMGSETRGLHSPSSGSTPTAGLASAAGPGPTSSYTDVRARGSGKDGARSRGQLEESSEWPKGVTSASESKRPRQLDSKRLEVGQWPDDESEDEDKQLDPSERRRQAVERQIQRELDEERRRREETRFKRQQQDHGATEQEDDEQQQQKGEQRDRERRQKQQEDYRRKFQEMQQAKERILAERANEKARLERLHQEQREEERRLLSEMDEPQRQEYLSLKQIREEQMRQQLEERRQKEGERNRLLLEAARQEAVSFLRQKGLMGQGLTLHGGLLLELMELEQGQNVTRPWVFSYFELMEILALETSVETE